MSKQEDIRKSITELMVNALKQGTPPWRKAWVSGTAGGLPCNFQSGRRYTGINPLILMFWSAVRGYESRFWGSYSSWMKNVGAHVMRGEKSVSITLFNMIPKRDPVTKKIEKNKKGENVLIPIMKEFPVFNAQQLKVPTPEELLDGRCKNRELSVIKSLLEIDDKKERSEVSTKSELMQIAGKYLSKLICQHLETREQIANAIHEKLSENLKKYLTNEIVINKDPDFQPAEDFIEATGAKISYSGDRAFFNVSSNEIVVPKKGRFETIQSFYETVFHELIHWQLEKTGWKGEYAMGELIAEIGACFLLTSLNVPLADKMLDNSVSYVKSWLKSMNDNPKFIFDAASLASKCVDQMLVDTNVCEETPIQSVA